MQVDLHTSTHPQMIPLARAYPQILSLLSAQYHHHSSRWKLSGCTNRALLIARITTIFPPSDDNSEPLVMSPSAPDNAATKRKLVGPRVLKVHRHPVPQRKGGHHQCDAPTGGAP